MKFLNQLFSSQEMLSPIFSCKQVELYTKQYTSNLNVSTDLSWSHHVGLICKKKLKSLLGCFTETFINFPAHTSWWNCINHWSGHTWSTLVQSGTHTLKDIQALENVQKFTLRVCSESWSCDYLTLLDTLSMPTLPDRRETLKLCLLLQVESYIPPVQSQSKLSLYHSPQ